MKQLLAVCWDMPPLSGPRAVQVSRTLKQLVSLGWESTVVCFDARSNRYNSDADLAERLRAPHGVTLVPVPSAEERLFFRALWRVCPPLKALPDEKWVWIGAASRAAKRLAAGRRFDAFVSFAQPWSDHLIGGRVHRATGLPWLAHFSDPWTDSPYARGGAWQRRIWRRMERDVIRDADALVFVTTQTAERVMRKYPDAWRAKAHVVPHGFEGQRMEREGLSRAAPLALVYTGRFYDGVRTPEPMLRALASLAARRPLARELHVAFVGTIVPRHQRLAAELGLDSIVEFTGRLPFAASAARAADADVLLVIDAPADDSLFLPSKLIDYLPLQTPILALTPEQGATADVIRALGYPMVRPEDEAGIARAIEALIEAKARGELGPSPSHACVAARYDVRATARSFADVLERLTA